jgi:hypothetical protein
VNVVHGVHLLRLGACGVMAPTGTVAPVLSPVAAMGVWGGQGAERLRLRCRFLRAGVVLPRVLHTQRALLALVIGCFLFEEPQPPLQRDALAVTDAASPLAPTRFSAIAIDLITSAGVVIGVAAAVLAGGKVQQACVCQGGLELPDKPSHLVDE